MNFETATDWDEAFEYLPGSVVELKAQPGVFYTIDRNNGIQAPCF
jgi:hypothetical protein